MDENIWLDDERILELKFGPFPNCTTYFTQLSNSQDLHPNHCYSSGPWTLLVPMNSAFSFLDPRFVEHLRDDKKRLRAFVMGHILPGRLLLSQIGQSLSRRSLLGDLLHFEETPRGVSVNGSLITVANLTASNGVVHIIDKVLAIQEPRTSLGDVSSACVGVI